ncbi:MAG: hypothetical protein WCO53_02550 [Deltaproteobacteria bacterium]
MFHRMIFLFVVVLALLATQVFAQVAPQGAPQAAPPAASAPPPPPQAQQQAPVQSATNAVTQAAVQKGVLNCAGRINQVVNFLGFTKNAGAVMMMPPNQPDANLIPIAMEIPIQNGVAYVSASFAPNQANGCGATYDSVVYWPQKCDVIANKNFGTLKRIGTLSKTIFIRDGGVTTKIFFMPAGNGCVTIKKEFVL